MNARTLRRMKVGFPSCSLRGSKVGLFSKPFEISFGAFSGCCTHLRGSDCIVPRGNDNLLSGIDHHTLVGVLQKLQIPENTPTNGFRAIFPPNRLSFVPRDFCFLVKQIIFYTSVQITLLFRNPLHLRRCVYLHLECMEFPMFLMV